MSFLLECVRRVENDPGFPMQALRAKLIVALSKKFPMRCWFLFFVSPNLKVLCGHQCNHGCAGEANPPSSPPSRVPGLGEGGWAKGLWGLLPLYAICLNFMIKGCKWPEQAASWAFPFTRHSRLNPTPQLWALMPVTCVSSFVSAPGGMQWCAYVAGWCWGGQRVLKDSLDQLGLKSGRDEPNTSQGGSIFGCSTVRMRLQAASCWQSFGGIIISGILWNLGIIILGGRDNNTL